MKYGICVGMEQLDRIRIAAQSGYDYIEANFAAMTQADEGIYEAFKSALIENSIPCEAANGFLPGTIRLTGPDITLESARAHVEKGMKRAHELGIKVIVFGSGVARKLPEGTSSVWVLNSSSCSLRKSQAPSQHSTAFPSPLNPFAPRKPISSTA